MINTNTYKKIISSLTSEQQLLVVSKQRTVEEISSLLQLGHLDFAENRLSELQEKSEYFCQQGQHNIRWHFIGPLQTKQIKKILCIPGLQSIQTCSSLKHAEELVRVCKAAQSAQMAKKENKEKFVEIYWQVNIAREAQKHGWWWPEQAEDFVRALQYIANLGKSYGLINKGLMCMGPTPLEMMSLDQHQHLTTESFRNLRLLAQRDLPKLISIAELFSERTIKLSMGMSSDYQLALEQGSSCLRIGSLFFE